MLRLITLLSVAFIAHAGKGWLETDDVCWFDQHKTDKAILDFYLQTKGPTNWPPVWRTRWGSDRICAWDGNEMNPRAPYGVRCKNGGWDPLPPKGDGGLMIFEHQSGEADGPIPEDFKVFQMVYQFVLHGNKLSGTIWNTSYHNFATRFDIGRNRFTGTLGDDFLSRCTMHCETINLSENQFSGSLPRSLSTLTGAISLLFNDNQFSGSIPEMSQLTRMSHLRLSNNQLAGTLGDWVSKAQRLSWIELENNAGLSGTLPELPPHVSIFNAAGTKFSGTIPASYGNLAKLRRFDCTGCDLQCPTPDLLAHVQFSTHCKPAGSRKWSY